MCDERCTFVVPKKGRRCRMRALAGHEYCGEHVLRCDLKNGEGHDRIICPLDATHTCSAALLSKHLKKCNAKAKEAHEYFLRNINSGLPKPEGHQNPCKLFLKDVSDEELLAIIGKLERICEALTDRPGTYVGLHEGLSAELDGLVDCAVAQKHLRQKAALLGLAESQGLLDGQACYIEFGAGRGRLSYWLAKILSGKGCRFLLVDRASSRHKFENKIRREEQDNSSEIQRLQIDIEHLCLGKVGLVKAHQGHLVGLCKHLCGEATDFAIRCLVETAGKTSDSSSAASALQGLLMAVCCHHRCRWSSFVGRPFLEQAGVSERDFELLTCLAGWATCAAREARSNVQANKDDLSEPPALAVNRYVRMNLSIERREEIGRRCKLLLDIARIRCLATAGLDARLVYFVDRDVTPENVAIVALPRKSTPC
ncbi:unnamed protein product [Ixodes hexagonus]